MPLIQKQAVAPKKVPLNVNIDEAIVEKFGEYCRFIGSEKAYMVAECLTHVMDSDVDFASHLASRPASSVTSLKRKSA
jgi:hypothetical protein